MSTAIAQRILDRYHGLGILGQFSGCILVAKDAEVLADVRLGLADYAQGTPFTAETVFYIASITKMFTAASILLLKEQGKLMLADPIGKCLPEYTKGAHVTVKQLLGHVSGIPEHTDKQAFWSMGDGIQSPMDIYGFIRDMDMDWEAGSRYAYCNSNYLLLGLIIEKLTGKNYGDFLSEHIFTPMNMGLSGYMPRGTGIRSFAKGYDVLYPQPLPANIIPPLIPFAAGGIYSSANDLFKWSEALFGGRMLTKESLQEMLTVDRDDYGLGIQMETLEIGGRKYTAAGHNGGIAGFCAKFLRVLETRHTFILLSNVDGPGQLSISDYFREVLSCVNAGM